MRTHLVGILIIAAAVAFPVAARADHFGVRAEGSGASATGVITSYGIDLFPIRSEEGGLTPLERTAIISSRLESLEEVRQIRPELFSVGYRNHQVIIQYMVSGQRIAHILVTVDQSLARQAQGSHGQVERLADWWLALLQDHVGLALGLKPVSTAGTPVCTALTELHDLVSASPGPLNPSVIRAAFTRLPASTQDLLRGAAFDIPPSFDPEAGSRGMDILTGVSPELPGGATVVTATGEQLASSTPPVISTGDAANPAPTNGTPILPSNPVNPITPAGTSVTVGENGNSAAQPTAPNTTPSDGTPAGATPVATAPTDAPAGAAVAAPGSTPEHHGPGYRIQVLTTPSPLMAGKQGVLTFKIDQIDEPGAAPAAVVGARLIGRIRNSETVPGAAGADPTSATPPGAPSPWIIVRPTEEKPGAYRLATNFKTAGKFRMLLTAILANGESFMAPLDITVASANSLPAAPPPVTIP